MAGSRSRNLLPVAGKSKTCEPVNQERLKEAALVKSGVWNMRLWRGGAWDGFPRTAKTHIAVCIILTVHSLPSDLFLHLCSICISLHFTSCHGFPCVPTFPLPSSHSQTLGTQVWECFQGTPLFHEHVSGDKTGLTTQSRNQWCMTRSELCDF